MTPEEFAQRMTNIGTHWQGLVDIFSQAPGGEIVIGKFFDKMASDIEAAEEKAGQEILAFMMQHISQDPALLMTTLKSMQKLNKGN